jgi:hypothetical protein
MSDVDDIFEYVLEHVHYVDNIRPRDGQWSMQLWLDKMTAGATPIRITGRTLTELADNALGLVLAWRIDQHTMPRDAATRRALAAHQCVEANPTTRASAWFAQHADPT